MNLLPLHLIWMEMLQSKLQSGFSMLLFLSLLPLLCQFRMVQFWLYYHTVGVSKLLVWLLWHLLGPILLQAFPCILLSFLNLLPHVGRFAVVWFYVVQIVSNCWLQLSFVWTGVDHCWKLARKPVLLGWFLCLTIMLVPF